MDLLFGEREKRDVKYRLVKSALCLVSNRANPSDFQGTVREKKKRFFFLFFSLKVLTIRDGISCWSSLDRSRFVSWRIKEGFFLFGFITTQSGDIRLCCDSPGWLKIASEKAFLNYSPYIHFSSRNYRRSGQECGRFARGSISIRSPSDE